jgi:hypothetical protein
LVCPFIEAEKLVLFWTSVPPMLPPKSRNCSGPRVGVNWLRPVSEPSRSEKFVAPRSGPTPGWVTTSTKVDPGCAASAAN